jgi:hypothetical protein
MKQLTILIFFLSFQLAAHESVETKVCNTPSNTGRITSDMEMEMLQAELVIYEKCMFDFIRDQQKQAEVHEQAAQNAMITWNDYLSSRMR